MYSNQEKANFVLWYHDTGENYSIFTRRAHHELGIHAHIPDHKTIESWTNKFKEEGSVQAKKPPGLAKTIRTPANIELVKNAINTPGASLKAVSHQLGKNW
jgi:transposase